MTRVTSQEIPLGMALDEHSITFDIRNHVETSLESGEINGRESFTLLWRGQGKTKWLKWKTFTSGPWRTIERGALGSKVEWTICPNKELSAISRLWRWAMKNPQPFFRIFPWFIMPHPRAIHVNWLSPILRRIWLDEVIFWSRRRNHRHSIDCACLKSSEKFECENWEAFHR